MNADQLIDGILDADLKRQRRLWVSGRIGELRRVLRPSCGNCQHWMKSSQCPGERNENGRQRGPSCSETPCPKFLEQTWELKWARDELTALEIERTKGGR